MTTWGFIGCGNLSQAIISGALKKKIFKANSVLITNRTLTKSKLFSRKAKVRIAKNNRDLILRSDIIFIATKPSDIRAVLEDLRNSSLKNKIIVSLAAGVGSILLKKYCKEARSIIRVMANTPATIQKGFFGIYPIKAKAKDRKKVFEFFGHLGEAIFVKSDFEIDIITAGAASGVGFVFSFMEEFEKWFYKMGLSYKQARLAAVTTFLGASEMAKHESENLLSELREKVTSKKGTTLAGLKALKRRKVGSGLKSGLDVAFKRAGEIAKSLLQN